MCITFILRIPINIGISCESCCVWMINTCRYKEKNKSLIHCLFPLKVSSSDRCIINSKYTLLTQSRPSLPSHSISMLNAFWFVLIFVSTQRKFSFIVYRQLRTVKTNAYRYIDCYLTNDCAQCVCVCVRHCISNIEICSYIYCHFAPTKMPK